MEVALKHSCGIIITALLLFLPVACTDGNKASYIEECQYYAQAPDYTDDSMWFVQENDKNGNGADVFYIVSTWETDWMTKEGGICHYADVYNERHRADMDKEISRIAGYMGEGNSFLFTVLSTHDN